MSLEAYLAVHASLAIGLGLLGVRHALRRDPAELFATNGLYFMAAWTLLLGGGLLAVALVA